MSPTHGSQEVIDVHRLGTMGSWIDNQNIPAEQKNLLKVQSEMQRMQEMVQLATTLMKALHEMSKSVIQNLAV